MCRTYSEVLQGETCGLMLLCSYLNVICCFWMFAASLKEFWIGTRYKHIQTMQGHRAASWNGLRLWARIQEPWRNPSYWAPFTSTVGTSARWEQQRLGLIASRRNPAERSRCHQLPGAYPARRRSTIGEAWPGLTQFWDARSTKCQKAQNLKLRTLLGVGTCWGSVEYRCLVKFVGGDAMMPIFLFQKT